MLGEGDGIKDRCRRPDIMSDAAYVILTDDDKANTGKFFIDDEVLIKAGVTDLASYSYVPGGFCVIERIDVKSQKNTVLATHAA